MFQNVGLKLKEDEQTSAEFFCSHLEKNIEQLSKIIGKSIDDSTMLLHIVLHDILMCDQCK